MQNRGAILRDARERDRLDRQDFLAMAVLTLVAAMLRLPVLAHASLWFDELLTWKSSNQPSLGALWSRGLSSDNIFPPGYFVITYAFIKSFGEGEFVLRFPAAIFGVLSVPAIYLLGKRLFSPVTGAISAVFMTLSYTCIYYSQEARPYSMMIFMAIVTTYLWHRAFVKVIVEGQRTSSLEVSGLWLALAISCYTHYFMVLLTAMQAAFFLNFAVRRRRGGSIVAVVVVGLILCGLPWLPQLLVQLREHSYWFPERDPIEAVQDAAQFLFGSSFTLGAAGILIAFLAVLPFGVGIFRPEGRREYKTGLVFLATCIVIFLVLEGVSLAFKPIFLKRYLNFCLPFAYIVIARQLDRLNLNGLLKVAMAFLPLTVVLFDVQSASHAITRPQRDDWRGMMAAMASKSPVNSRVALLCVTEQVGVSEYYARNLPSNFVARNDVAAPDQVPSALNRVTASAPAYIWVFFGQVNLPKTMDTVNATVARVRTVSTQVDVITDEAHSLSATLFRVDTRGTGDGSR